MSQIVNQNQGTTEGEKNADLDEVLVVKNFRQLMGAVI